MHEPQIILAEPSGFPAESLDLLRQVGRVTLCEPSRAALIEAIPPAEVLWVRLGHKIDAELMAKAPALSLIVTATTGLNHIDLKAAEQHGIEVISLKGKTDFLKDVRATAEHTIGLMLALIRHLPAAGAEVISGGWRRDPYQGTEIYRKTVGLFGYGRLGKIVAPYLRAFDAEVLVTDPLLDQGFVAEGIGSVKPEELLGRSDIVSLHVDLRDETKGFFGAPLFKAMKSGAFFINTSRGELIDEAALLDGLESGAIRGAALDVLSNEQTRGMGESALVKYAQKHHNLIITPHIGGCTVESMGKAEHFLAQELYATLHRWAGKEAVASAR